MPGLHLTKEWHCTGAAERAAYSCWRDAPCGTRGRSLASDNGGLRFRLPWSLGPDQPRWVPRPDDGHARPFSLGWTPGLRRRCCPSLTAWLPPCPHWKLGPVPPPGIHWAARTPALQAGPWLPWVISRKSLPRAGPAGQHRDRATSPCTVALGDSHHTGLPGRVDLYQHRRSPHRRNR